MHGPNDIEWRVSSAKVDYPAALAEMEQRNAAVQAGEAKELIWLLEHPPLYTAGTSSDPAELLSQAFPVYVPRAGPAGRLCHPEPEKAQCGCAGICSCIGGLGDCCAG